FFFFFNDTATTEIYTLSLHDALPLVTWNSEVTLFLGLVGGVEGVLQSNKIFAGFESIQSSLFGFELLAGVGRGLDGEPDAPVRFVDFNDAGRDFLADLEDVLDLIDALFADLGDVDQPVNLVLQADERAEAREFGDLAGDQVADLIIMIDVAPRIDSELLDADRDALIGLIDFEHNRLDLVALLEHLGGMIDLARPGNVRDVDHAVQTFLQFDESAIAGKIANLAFDF